MEKIKVNMSPNPLDVQTIHASQNDGEARQWEFELHNNGDVIDSSEVTDQITFKAYKGGTEELLPSGLLNGSVDLGSFDWSYNEQYQCFITYPVLTDSAYVNTTSVPNFESIYKAVSWSAGATDVTQDMTVCYISSANQLRIRNKSFADATAFKESLQGVTLWYEKADSTPSTSPFDGTIKYPSGSVDSYFTYRQSPTEEDGLAKITDVKGNTLVWNQLVHGDFGNNYASYWSVYSGTGSVSNGVLTVTNAIGRDGVMLRNSLNLIQGHYYYCSFEYKSDVQLAMHFVVRENILPATNAFVKFSNIYQFNGAVAKDVDTFPSTNGQTGTFSLKNVQCMDLTALGIDNLTTVQEVEGWLSNNIGLLPYYAYNQGSLLSFNGNGIKTVGKNLLEPPTSGSVNGVTFTVNSDGSITINGTATSNGTYDLYRNQNVLPSWAKAGETYTLSLTNAINRFDIFSYDSSGTSRSLASVSAIASQMFTIPNDAVGLLIRMFVSSDITYDVTVYPQIEFGTTVTSYEPYTSSTTNIPISTYFPTGMKSAYNSADLTDIVRDELSKTKATKKVKQFTFDGSSDEGWSIENISSGSASGQHNFYINVAPAKKLSLVMNNIAVPYALYTQNYIDGKINAYVSNGENLNFYPGTDITSVADFRTWLSNHPLTVNIALPTDGYEENSFSTASLVTENAEIPLSSEDGTLIGKCTEQLSENPGFIDAKIKLSDSDGECYSNKIQLHIERSPQ